MTTSRLQFELRSLLVLVTGIAAGGSLLPLGSPGEFCGVMLILTICLWFLAGLTPGSSPTRSVVRMITGALVSLVCSALVGLILFLVPPLLFGVGMWMRLGLRCSRFEFLGVFLLCEAMAMGLAPWSDLEYAVVYCVVMILFFIPIMVGYGVGALADSDSAMPTGELPHE